MNLSSRSAVAVLFLSSLLFFPAAQLAYSQPTIKKKVLGQADLPRHSYPMDGLASALLQADDATFNKFLSNVSTDIESELRNLDIEDHATLRNLLLTEYEIQVFAGKYQEALKTVEMYAAAEDKLSAKLTSTLWDRAYLRAEIETNAAADAVFKEAFSRRLDEELSVLPWEVVQKWAKRTYSQARLFSPALGVAEIMTNVDPTVQESHLVNDSEAGGLINVRFSERIMFPLIEIHETALKNYIAAHNGMKHDIWSDREVTLTNNQSLTPVLVAICDCGIDLDLFPTQLFDDPLPTASGHHGLAFDDQGYSTTNYLRPLTSEQQGFYAEFRDDMKGQLDIEEGNASPEADSLERKLKTLPAEELHRRAVIERIIDDDYIHGTHCAGIAARGNPAVRLVVASFNDSLRYLPFPPSQDWVRRMEGNFHMMSEYFRTRNVRVVNMSWRDNPAEFEDWLSKTGDGADPAGRKKKAAELFSIWKEAIEAAIKGAPNTLFVAGAGNSDSNNGFIDDVPSSLNLSNLMTVGAVDQAGDETYFTSYGESVAVHADGYDVDSIVPGGYRLKMSGTSMAAPSVVNLAAKLLALDPALTPENVIDLIKRGATATEDGRRLLIDEKQSIALLALQRPK